METSTPLGLASTERSRGAHHSRVARSPSEVEGRSLSGVEGWSLGGVEGSRPTLILILFLFLKIPERETQSE
jgi:hypothetical protein